MVIPQTLFQTRGAGDARSVGTMGAERGAVSDVDDGVLASLVARDLYPALAMARLRPGVSGPIVARVLVLAGQKAVVAALAEGHIDDEMRFLHVLFQSSPRAMAGVLPVVPT